MPANYKQVLAEFDAKSANVRTCFDSLPTLVRDYEWDVSISYVFTRLEAVKHETLYCGIVKLHQGESTLTRTALDADHMSRSKFRDLFKTVFGKPIDADILKKLAAAESIRDKVAHGKKLTQAQARQCLSDALDFADLFDAFVSRLAGFHPFGDLRGFKGRREALSKQTTRWVLRGMGILGSGKDVEPADAD